VPAGESASLAGAILRILGDPALAKTLATAGRKLVIEKFTLERQVRETESLYRQVSEKRVTRFAFPLASLAKAGLRRNEAR
jgi:glycosyltransferase involved in cell wall biosynthesis